VKVLGDVESRVVDNDLGAVQTASPDVRYCLVCGCVMQCRCHHTDPDRITRIAWQELKQTKVFLFDFVEGNVTVMLFGVVLHN